jgi:hypothetical protein
VPPVLPPVTSPQDTLTQTTSTTAARSCSGCALSIAPEEKHYEFRMSDEEVFYHVACFACIDCGMALEPQTFKTRGAAVYCATHFAERFFPRCGGCNEPITTDVFSVALGKSWHKGHFKCFACGRNCRPTLLPTNCSVRFATPNALTSTTTATTTTKVSSGGD